LGDGGAGTGALSSGGASGSIKEFELVAPNAELIFNQNTTGGSGGSAPTSKGGKGGDVTHLHGTAGKLSVFAPRGGNATGVGGNGGSIKNLDITDVATFVRLIKAGDGGNGNTAGSGGSLTDIKVAGDIGDFTSDFQISATSGMGGLIAGRAGISNGIVAAAKNGSIATVQAERIAAILAGAPASNALTADNAVIKITGITGATQIGADVNTNTTFDFTDSGVNGFNLGEGDTALDGLVIVKTGQFVNPPVTPLKLVEV
jgi:hypothetical protein